MNTETTFSGNTAYTLPVNKLIGVHTHYLSEHFSVRVTRDGQEQLHREVDTTVRTEELCTSARATITR